MSKKITRIDPTIGGQSESIISDSTRYGVQRRERPLLILVLAGLLLVSGLAIFFLPFLALGEVFATYRTSGYSAFTALAQSLALGLICMLGGIGVWEGKRWGWAFSVAALLYGIATSLQGFLYLYGLGAPFSLMHGQTISPHLKFSGKFLLHLAFLAYLFSGSVLGFFDLTKLRAIKLFAITVILFSLFLAVSIFIN
jgi:hypothetical protein